MLIGGHNLFIMHLTMILLCTELNPEIIINSHPCCGQDNYTATAKTASVDFSIAWNPSVTPMLLAFAVQERTAEGLHPHCGISLSEWLHRNRRLFKSLPGLEAFSSNKFGKLDRVGLSHLLLQKIVGCCTKTFVWVIAVVQNTLLNLNNSDGGMLVILGHLTKL
jgi:hypothetical protein